MTEHTAGSVDRREPTNEASMAAALKRFGWTCGPEFWQRYYTDPWVFNLANAVERLTVELDDAQVQSIVDRNPGIDEDEVRRFRAGVFSDGKATER